MQANYEAFIARVINRYEGGYGWDRGDPGGPTKYGITCFDLAEHRGVQMTSMSAWAPLVKAMTLQEAEDIYRTKYAKKLYFDLLRAGPDCCILDYGINSGTGRPLAVARKILQLPASYQNPAVVAAINNAHAADPKWFVDAMCQERLQFMHAIRGGSAWAEFGKGWGARMSDVDSYCDHLATGAPAPTPPAPPAVIHPKVTHASQAPSTTTTIGSGAGAAGAAHVGGMPHWVLPVAFGTVVVGGLAYALYKSKQAALANAAVVIPKTVPPMPAAVIAAIGASHVA